MKTTTPSTNSNSKIIVRLTWNWKQKREENIMEVIRQTKIIHYSDVIMLAMASQFSLAIVYSTSYSGADQRKHRSSASLAFVRGIHLWIPRTKASNAENVSIWWRHHILIGSKWSLHVFLLGHHLRVMQIDLHIFHVMKDYFQYTLRKITVSGDHFHGQMIKDARDNSTKTFSVQWLLSWIQTMFRQHRFYAVTPVQNGRYFAH